MEVFEQLMNALRENQSEEKLFRLENERIELKGFLERCLSSNQSGSIFLSGPRYSGKSIVRIEWFLLLLEFYFLNFFFLLFSLFVYVCFHKKHRWFILIWFYDYQHKQTVIENNFGFIEKRKKIWFRWSNIVWILCWPW